MRKITRILLIACVMMLAAVMMIPSFAAESDAVKVDLSENAYTVEADGEYVVAKGEYENTLTVKSDATITLDNVTVNAGEGLSAISIESGNVTLIIKGSVSLNGGNNGAGIYVAEGATLTIKDTGARNDKLTAIGNAGADDSDGAGAAGIGGSGANGSSGTITIDGANVTALGYGKHGCGIGSASGTCGKINIVNGATVLAQGGYYANGEGVTINDKYGKNDPEGGAAIGGSCGKTVAPITIKGSTVVAIGGSKAAGIGAIYHGSVELITIDNSNVTAYGGSSSAGIGTSREGDYGVSATIVINNSKVYAEGGELGSGIGSGYNNMSLTTLPTKYITVSGNSVIEAIGTEGGAGIGGGYKGNHLVINIKDNAVVTATAGKLNGLNAKTVEDGGLASAIGSGANGSSTFVGSDIEISADATIVLNTYNGAGKTAINSKGNEVVVKSAIEAIKIDGTENTAIAELENVTVIDKVTAPAGAIGVGVVLDGNNGSYIYFDISGMVATNSIKVKLYSNNTLIGTMSLAQIGVNEGVLNLSGCSACFGIGFSDSYWDREWETFPRADMVPDKAVLYIDGYKVGATNEIRMYNYDYSANAREWYQVNGVYTVIVENADGTEDKYFTLADAVANAENGSTVVLLSDAYLSETLTVAEKQNITIDLNGNDITVGYQQDSTTKHIYAIDNYGTLILTDIEKSGSITARGIENLGNGVLTIEDGVTIVACDTNGGAAIWNEAALTVNGGKFITTTTDVVSTLAPGALNNSGTAVINGGHFEATGGAYAIISSSGDLTIQNATVKGRGGIAVYDGTATVKAGTVIETVAHENTAHCIYASGGKVVIEGGKFTANDDNDCGNSVICVCGADITVLGGTFRTNEYTKAPYIHSNYTETSKLVIKGGNFDKTPDEACLAYGYAFVLNSEGTYDVEELKAAKIGDTIYHYLQDAIDAAKEGDTVKLLANITVTESVKIASDDKITLDLNGYTLQTDADVNDTTSVSVIVNEGYLTVIDSAATKGAIISNDCATDSNGAKTKNGFAISSIGNSTLIIDGATIVGTNWGYALYVVDNATLTVEDGSVVEGRGAVYLDGNAVGTINGGEFAITVQTTNNQDNVVYVGGSAKLTIKGGTFNGADVSGAQRVAVASVGTSTLVIEGGTFNSLTGDVQVKNTASVSITNGEFNGTGIDFRAGELAISGGTFSYGLDEAWCAYGYELVENEDGVYGVEELKAAKIGDTIYHYLSDAIIAANAVTDGSTTTIVLLDDVDFVNRNASGTIADIKIKTNVILDLNGYTVNAVCEDGTSSPVGMWIEGGCLTVKDSSESMSGTIKAGNGTSGNAIVINNSGEFILESGNIYSNNNGICAQGSDGNIKITVNGGTITAEPNTTNSAVMYLMGSSNKEVAINGGTLVGYNGILMWDNCKLTITGGSITGKSNTAIQGNGSKDNTEIVISGGYIEGYWAGIYHPQGGTIEISGDAYITGYTGVVLKGGDLTVSGGTICGTGEKCEYTPVSSGYSDTGDALYVEHYDSKTSSDNYGTPTVTVTGGTFVSTHASAIASYANSSNSVEALEEFVSGGTFNGDIDASLAAKELEFVKNEDGTYGVQAIETEIVEVSISAGKSLSVLYYVKGVSGLDLTMVFEFNGNKYEVEGDYVDGQYVFVLNQVAPQLMAENIKATLYDENGKVDALEEYSVKKYAQTILDGDYSDALKTLISDMLVYGEKAQNYLGITENLITAGIENLQATDMEKVELENELKLTNNTCVLSAGVIFDYANRIYFKISASTEGTIKYNDTEIAISSLTKDAQGNYVFVTDAIYACDYAKTVTITVNDVTTVVYSIQSFAVYAAEKEQTNAANLAKAAYVYGLSASAYLD